MRTKRVSLRGLDAYISDVMARHPEFVAEINRIVDTANGWDVKEGAYADAPDGDGYAKGDVPRPAIPATASGMVAEWGERCPDYEPGCPICEAWREFDA